ncbi:MAG TPA: ABC transporter ATP-binding protein [Candidatus Hydrogenedens sp.]|nr:ABC transporter ATP-binding protein [Candidatus Hydrogenedens sp.]
MNPILTLQNVSFQYRADKLLFNNLTLLVASGKLTALIGPNGSGKSTLLRLLASISRPTAGEILLNQTPLKDLPIREKAQKIAFLPQSIFPIFPLTVFEIIAMGRFPRKSVLSGLSRKDYEIIENCLNIMNLTKLRDRPYSELSGGECKRTLIASTLAQEPEILLLDEPLSGLDAPYQVETLHHLYQIANMGYTVIIATHEINTVTRFAHEFILISSDHEIISQGRAEETLTVENLNRAYDAHFWVGKHPLTNTLLVEVEQRTQP